MGHCYELQTSWDFDSKQHGDESDLNEVLVQRLHTTLYMKARSSQTTRGLPRETREGEGEREREKEEEKKSRGAGKAEFFTIFFNKFST